MINTRQRLIDAVLKGEAARKIVEENDRRILEGSGSKK